MEYKVLRNFKVKVSDKVVELVSGQVLKLEKAQAEKLIKIHKIEPVDFEGYFKDAVGKINQEYPSGVLGYAREKHLGRFQESLQLENRLNDFWGKDFGEFQKIVDAWKDIHLELVKLFKNLS